METKNMNLSSLSINDLKALAYDRIILIERLRIELQQIQSVLAEKEKHE